MSIRNPSMPFLPFVARSLVLFTSMELASIPEANIVGKPWNKLFLVLND